MLLKPRFGRRRWSGICPPSKPLMATPVRAFCPLTPRPPVLPLPEPMPRPIRMRALRAPGRSAISLSFMRFSSRLVDDANEMADFVDHPAHGRIVRQRLLSPDLIEPEADQGGTLLARPPDRAARLLDGDGLAALGHGLSPYAS